jgi:hypothetical protein
VRSGGGIREFIRGDEGVVDEGDGVGTVVNMHVQFTAASASHDVGLDVLGIVYADVNGTRLLKGL